MMMTPKARLGMAVDRICQRLLVMDRRRQAAKLCPLLPIPEGPWTRQHRPELLWLYTSEPEMTANVK